MTLDFLIITFRFAALVSTIVLLAIAGLRHAVEYKHFHRKESFYVLLLLGGIAIEGGIRLFVLSTNRAALVDGVTNWPLLIAQVIELIGAAAYVLYLVGVLNGLSGGAPHSDPQHRRYADHIPLVPVAPITPAAPELSTPPPITPASIMPEQRASGHGPL